MLESNADPNKLSRLELLELAQQLRVSDADVMTRAELRAAIEKARRPEPRPRVEPVTWVSVARRLLASIVEQGLNLPDAAALIRGDTKLNTPLRPPPPVATVTLARIYAAQGHLGRALGTLDEVLTSDPDHDMARELRAQLKQRLEQQTVEQQAAEHRAAEAARGSEAPVAPPADAVATPLTPDEPLSAEAVQASAVEPSAVEPSAEQAGAAAEPVPFAAPEIPPTRVELESSVASSDAVAEPPAVAVPSAPEPPAEALPAAPGLVLIEGAPQPYLYWELADVAGNDSSSPHWISIVTHTPNGAGCVREERQFPVHDPRGALRLEGLPRRAVVRARLSRHRAPESRPLVVAACVSRQREAGPQQWVTRFAPHSSFDATLSDRALQRLQAARPVYW